MFPIHGHSKFCHIIDEVYNSTLVKTFNNIWNEDIVALLPSTEIIDEHLNICHDMALFKSI